MLYPIKFSEASWNSMLSNKKIIPRSLSLIVHEVNWSARAVVMKPSSGPHLTLFRAHFNEFHALPRLNGRTIQLCANWKNPRSSFMCILVCETLAVLNGWLFSCWNQFCLLCWHGQWNKAGAFTRISTRKMHITEWPN